MSAPQESPKDYAVVLYNSKKNEPPPSNGMYIVNHTLILQPFEKTFTIGNKTYDLNNGTNISFLSQKPLEGAFIGNRGHFLSMSNFMILTPKDERKPLKLNDVMCPTSNTHCIKMVKERDVTVIRPGCLILKYDEEYGVHFIIIFLKGKDTYYHTLMMLSRSLAHFKHEAWNKIIHRMASKKEALTFEAPAGGQEPQKRELEPTAEDTALKRQRVNEV